MRKCECHLHHSPKEILEPVLLSVCMLVCITHTHTRMCVCVHPDPGKQLHLYPPSLQLQASYFWRFFLKACKSLWLRLSFASTLKAFLELLP